MLLNKIFAGKDIKVVEDVTVLDSHYGKSITTDLFRVNDAQGKEVIIAADSNNMLFEVIEVEGVIGLNNSNGFGSIYPDTKKVEGWNFDREPKATLPEGFASTGRYAQVVA